MHHVLEIKMEAARNGWVLSIHTAGFGRHTLVALSDADAVAAVRHALACPPQEGPLHRRLGVRHAAQDAGVDLAGRGAEGHALNPQQIGDPALTPVGDDQCGGDPAGGLDAGRGDLGGFVGHGLRSCGDGAGTSMPEPSTPAN